MPGIGIGIGTGFHRRPPSSGISNADFLAPLSAFYKFDDDPTDDGTPDSTANANHLSVQGEEGPNLNPSGKVNGCADFTGANWLSVASNPTLKVTNKWFLAFWVKPAALDGQVINKSNNNIVRIDSDGSLVVVLNAAGIASLPAATLALNTWAHVGLIYDGTQTGNGNRLKLYINRVAQVINFNSTTIPATVNDSDADLTIGNNEDFDAAYSGLLEELAYGNTLPADPVAAVFHHYDKTNAGQSPIM